MSRRPRRVGALVALVIVLGADLARAGRAVDAEWVRVETQDFIVLSSVGEKRARGVLRDLYRFRDTLRQVIQGASFEASIPTYVFLFEDDEMFRLYKGVSDGKPRNISGYFIPAPDANYMALDASAEQEAFGILYHEYVHFVATHNLPGLPLWANEGLAEFYSTFRIHRDQIEIGHSIDRHVELLRKETWMPLSRLLAVDEHSSEYHEAAKQGLFYAQSWALIHTILTEQGEWHPRFQSFCTLLRSRIPADEAWRQSFEGVDEVLLRESQSYVHAKKGRYFRLPLPEEGLVDAPRTVAMTRADVLVSLGDLLVHNRDAPRSLVEQHFRRAVEADPSHAGAHLGLAHLAERDENREVAKSAYEKAVAADPQNARALADYGTLLLVEISEKASVAKDIAELGSSSELRRAQDLFRRSLEQDPEAPQALAGYGATFLFEDPVAGAGESAAENLEEAVSALERAADMLPERPDVLANLILLTARSGAIGRAQTLLETRLVPLTPEPGVIPMVEQGILTAAQMEADRLHQAGRGEEAEALLAATAQRLRTRELAAMAEAARDSVAHLERMNRSIEVYNQGVEAASQGDFDEALRLFEKVAAEAPEAELRAAAADNVRRVGTDLEQNRLVGLYNTALDHFRNEDYPQAEVALEELLRSDPPQELRLQAEKLLAGVRDLR